MRKSGVARGKAGLSAAAFVGAWLAATTAGAFCRTTTCDASDPQGDCSFDTNGCSEKGIPLAWPTQCVSFGIQKDGSPLRQVTYDAFKTAVDAAFSQWTATECAAGGHPSFKMWNLEGIDCGEAEFNECLPNANTWMFRDSDWPYVGSTSTLALTTITFDLKKGTILDADVEVNSFGTPISTSDSNVTNDLQSIATHESGHFLGLAHSSDPAATMNAHYNTGDLSFRSLADDDHTAICTVYPPGRTAGACSGPTPLNGFSRACGGGAAGPKTCTHGSSTVSGGCAVNGAPQQRSPWAGVAGIGLSLLLFRRVRRAARRRRDRRDRRGAR